MKNTNLWTRVCPAALVLALAFAPLGCKRKSPVRVQQTEEESPRMASTVQMGNPRSESQLVNGFYGVEEGSWRWTARRFSVVLRPPFGAAQKGAVLKARLTVPDSVIAKLKTTSLTATVGGQALAPETYTTPGNYTYTRDVPPGVLGGDSVRVEFQLDKAMPPGGGDMRELGVVMLSIGLESK